MPIAMDACFAIHQGDRKDQQDRVAIVGHERVKGTVLAVLADGMGGKTGGALASEQVIHTATTNLQTFAPSEETPEEMLKGSFTEAHAIIKMSRFMNEKDPHSTAVALLVQPGRASWAHCGDSRLYRFHGERITFRTTDHSYVEHLVATGEITPEQALHHPNRNVLMTCLGGRDEPYFDIQTAELAAGDSFLLCSDGLWAYFSDVELGNVISENSAREASEILVDRARKRGRGAGDNISLAIVKLFEVPEKKPAPKPNPALAKPYS